MTNINYKLTKVQENLLNIENLREVKEINNICASLEIPAKYTTDEILFSLNIMLRKIDHLRIEVLSNKEQYIRSYQEFNNILIKKFESVSELDSFIEVWKKDSIFDFKKPLHEFLIVEINGVKKQLLIKFHHLISDIQFITQFSNTFVGLLLNDINIEEVSGSYSQKTILNQEETIEFWEKELESFEGENLYKENSKNLGTEVIKEIIPQELIRKFEESKISKDTTLFDFILAGVIFSKKVKTFTSGASVGLAVTQNDGWNSNTSLLPIIPKIDLETSIKKYILDVSEKKAIIKKFCDYTISEMIENNGIESFESLTDISCMEMNYELKHRYLKLGFKFKVIGSGSRTNPLTIMINYMNEKPFILYEYQTFSIKLPELQRLHLFIMYILEQFIDNIDKKLASVPLLKKQEEVYFEKRVKDFNKSETITGLFKKQVEKFPNKIAVRYNKEGVTFKELDKKCSELANLLINKGVCSGQVIASTLVGIDAIVAIFAILKVGGIYLPVDKENPFERIKYILSDSLCKLLITSDEELSNSLKINTIIYDSLLVEKNTNLNSFPKITSDNLAYIIYTSGSTGVPKGVMIKHSSVINMCEALINDIGIEENDIIQQFASHSFDASILEIFGALLNGCTLVMVNHEEKQNPNLLQDMWDTEKVTFAIIPPVYMQNLDTKRETTLKYLMTAGEEANWNFILEWKDKVKYFNAYGPTEATVWTSTWEYRNFDTNLSVPIGRPIQNVSCHVFQGIQECGLEIPGELYISGDSLSVGYINNDSKNEKSFLLHPRTKEKMYRTGDIVYWNSEKELVFCGRKDNQVKVRGHRIDLSELNSIILKQNEVKEVYSCITNLNSKNSEKEVVVYVVLQNPIDKNTFRKKIIDQLPTYMQPHHIIEIAKLPMTLNGKVDKKSLPSIIRESKVSLLDTIDNSTKKDIIEVFEEILKITIENENIDFYSLGGDSIKAIRIVSKLKNRGYKLRTNDIVDSKSIDEIILRLGNTNEEKLISQPFESDIILSPIQKEFFRKDFFVKEHFNQCETLYINSSLNDLEIKSIFKELTENHILFKVNFDQNNQPFINRGRELFLFESHDFKDLNSDEFNIKFKLICEKNQNKFDLENSPLINIVLFKSSTGSYIFITIHHLIIDGVSWRLLNDELNTIFTKRIENREIDLPRENITFFEWARKLDKYQTRILKEEKSYWDKINNDLEKINSSKTKLSINNINSKKITIDMDDSLFLTGNSKHAYRINDIFLAALIKAVNSDTLALMLESHGRESIEQNIENDSMIGWFTSIYPVIFENKKDFDDLLASVSCITKRIPNRGLNYLAYKDQKISNYEKVFEPLIVFNYLGDFQENLEHIKLVHLDMGDRNSKSNHLWFPLTITGQSINNNLFFEFKFEQSYFSISEIEKIAERFKNNIHTIIEKINSQDCMAKYGDCSWSKEELQSTIETTKINGLEIEKIYPLSYMQENFLFNKMLDKQDKYIVQVVMNVYKELKEEKIYSVMEKMASRFEILRTAIFYKQQKVARNVQFVERNIPVTFEDFDGFDSQTIDKQIKKYIAKEKKSSWDFEKDPLFRVHVINIGENQSKLIWSFHHIIMDGWCLDIINNLFIQLYEEIDYQENQKISEYSDFVELLDSNNEIKTKYFWENYLENFEGLPILLPEKDNSYKKIKKSDLDEVGIKLTLELTELIQNLGKKIKVGVGTILESAWGIVLQAYSASNDVVFGKIISGRDVQLPGIDNMVGLFINTIPIRIKTDPNLSVSQLLKYQQRKNYLVNGNEMISLSEINNLIDQKISSLFSFDVFNDSHPEWMKHEKTFEQTDYTLNLSIIQEEKLYIKMMYDSNKYYESTIIDMLKRFKFILEQFVENENQPLRDIKFSWKEEEKIIEEYSQNIQPSIKVEKNIVSQFKDIANKFMNKVALNFSGETMTYEELDNKSTVLALQLRKSGINQGDYVLSLQEKGMEPIISFLAILKINAVYVPLDISVPKERFTYILEDSKAQYILINNTLNDERKRIIKDKSINVISVDKNLLLENKFEYIEYDYPCENLAYIIYTSGTTGKPKGTLISHNGAVNMALGMNLEFEFKNSSEVLLQFASLAFDASILEILTSLLNGHTLVIVPEEKRLNPDSVTQIMNEFKVTWAVLPPVFVNELNPEKLVTLKSLKTAGEEATWEIVDKWKNHLSYANGYGPTEATVWSTTWFENREKLHKKIPIGRPAPNVRCIIFQKEKVCGFGMVGELCISGPGVAIGYLNNETLTNEKFFLFEGEKFYRTGDYARWHYDGNIEFLGRMDKQIKIRGNRVELSEIEDNIKNIASIIDCVVLAKGEGANKELIAYLITADSFDTITLRNRLSSVIPSYMIPSKFIKIKKIPLTANGKIDTPRLLSLTDVKNETENNELSKLITSSTFREVQAVFSEILGINNVKISDDFFVLGGHSIKAARLINRLNSNFSLQIKLEQFFESPTISFILSQIEQSNSQKKPKKTINLDKSENLNIVQNNSVVSTTSNNYSIFQATDTQKRIYALQMVHKSSTSYNMPLLLKSNERLDLNKLNNTYKQILDKFEILKSNFHMHDDKLMLEVKNHISSEIKMISCEEQEIENVFSSLVKPFDLENDSLIRMNILRTTKNDYVFIDIHHSINDGYSTSLFTSELMKKYRGEQTLPVLMPSAELNDLLNNENLDSSDNYWKETFSQKPTLLDLPLDFPRVSRGNESGDEILIEIDKNLKKNIDNFCSSNSITLYMFFASLTMYYLSILTNQRDIIIGTAINSRLFEKSENTFGMYTNTLPLRGTINQDDDFATIIQKTKKVVLKLFENQLYPLDRIIKLHNSNTDYTRNPLFDVFLAFNKVKTLEDGFLKQIPIKSKTSPFDITIDILEIDSTLTIRWEFKKAIFRKETIERLSNEYLTLLMESINTPIVKSEKTEQIKAVIEGVLNNKVIFSESFLEQGGDSIKAIRISSKLAEKSIILDSDKILGCNNLYELLQDSQSIENSKDNSDLIYILKSELNEKDLDLEKDFLSQGGDSIKAIRIASKFKEIGFKVEPEEILQSISLKKLFHTKNEIGIIENNSDDNILISPIIEEFFSQNLKNPNFFNQSVLLELKFEDKYEDIIKIFDRLTEEHSIFKENFSDSKISSNRFIEVKRPSYKIDFIECTDKEFIKNCKSYCNNAQNKFDISSTPLLSLVYFKTEKRVLLFICAHHLVIDGVSWRILLDDFIYLQNQLNQNKELTLPYKTMDYKSWLNELQKHGDSEEVTGELSYWNNVVSKISEGKIQLEEPRDKQFEGNPFKKIKISISEDETKSLQKLCNPRDDIQINDLLLTALAFAMNSITNQKLLSLNLEGHGRESINNISKVDRTIGWFTTNYPLILDCSDKDIWDLLNKTKAAIRRIPKKGFNFGILKYCKRILNSNEMSECSFNFMGNIDNNSSSLVMSDYDFGNSMDENNTLWSPLNFNGIIQNKCLKFIIDFNSNKFKKSDIEELGKKFKEAILSFINNNDRGELLPLTPSQEGILFQKLTNDNPNLYSTQTLFEILGNNLDLESLKLALSKLSTKHPALSMRIVESDSGSYLQKVDEIKDISVTEFDYSNSTIDLNEILTKVKSIEMNKDFYLEKGNLFRAIIIKANDQKTYLLLSFHHIVFDGWSLANLLKTLSITYKYYVDNEYVKLDRYLSKKDNYKKYLKFIGGIEDNNGKEYWVNLLGDYDGESDFKNLETNVHNRSLSGNLRHNVPKYVYDKLTHLSSKLSVTRNTILEVVWGLLIQRFNYTSDSVFGKVVSGRNFEIENIGSIVGMLINTIPTRISVENNETIKELILKNKQQLIQGQHYQYVSPSEIQKLLGRRTPLFSTVYSYSNFVSDNQLFEFVNGITLQVCEGVENPSYDISCIIHDTGDYMSFQLSFNIEKFSDDTINNLLQTMENILEYICFYPEHKVKDIQVLNQEQLRKLYLKNQENQKEICLANIPEAISQNAIHNPEKTAIFYLDEKISFKELESKSNALADILLQNGIKTEDRVGIYLSKSPMVIISMLAVMKAGACCVTMDKSLPFERVSFQLEDAGVKILFTDDEKSGNLQNIKIIQPDQCNLKMNSEKPRVVLDKNNVAYVLYTSGSTGTPKGSLIEYQGLMNLFDYIGEKFQLKNNARILQFASLSFDASVLEIFGALVNNSQLVIVPDNIRNSPEDIKNLINEMQVTFALIPPVLMPFFKPDELNTLKYIMNAGDEASPEIAKIWSQKMCYINGYGPSEASIWTTDWTIYKLQDELKKCPIGKPIQNVNVHIMNNGVLVGDYMPGELCISGISLSRGYLNRDELNKQVFFEDRLISKSRIYRTGDLVRRLPNGNIEYLGRIDRQVKIRGFRIELGEIESQILNISSIKQAACCIVSENNDKHIVAYIVSDNNILSAEVKLILQKKLPYYMIPERIVSIDSLPTTINGKVDRKTLENFGLPKIENLAEDLKMSFREREFCEVLEKILKIDISNVLQPLSNIISDSITAMRIVAKLNKLGYMISLKDILSKKSIRDLHLENSIATIPEEITEKKMTQKNERRLSKPYSITYKQDFKSKNKYSIYKATKMQQWIKKQPMIVSGAIFDIEGDYDYTDIINSLKKVVKENGVLRSAYVYIDNVLNIKEYPFDTAWEISFVDLSDRYIEDIKLIYEIEQNRFEDNEIFKENEHACELVLLKENDTKYRVYLRIHHIFWDAYSAEIFEKSVKNNLEFPDLKSDTIPSYSEYAKLVNSTEEVNHRIFSIKSFEEVSNQYKTGFVKNNSKVFSSIIVKPKFRKELPLIDNLWGVIGRTILSYGKQFNINEDWPSKMPAFILFKGRCGKLEKFSNTLGMFLELIPVIVKNGSLSELDNSLRCQVEEYKNSRNITSLDFINFISSNDYKQEDEFEYDHVPVVNFLGIYEFLEGNEFFSSIKLKQLKKGTSNNSLIISIKEETVQVGIYASEEKALTLKSDIEGEV